MGVVTGRGFTSSLDVVIVFFSFRSLSWELCLALDANDSEAMVVEEDDEELFLLVTTGSRGTKGAETLFFTDLSDDFLPDMSNFCRRFSGPFNRSVVRLLVFWSRDLIPLGASCPLFLITSLAFDGFMSLLFLAVNLFCSSSFICFCSSSLLILTSSFLPFSSCSFFLPRETAICVLFCSASF